MGEPATDLDREVYQAMVDEGMLQADVTGVDISLYDYYSDNYREKSRVDYQNALSSY